MSTVTAPTMSAFRIYPHGLAHPTFESPKETEARDRARALSTEQPSIRIELRGVPAQVKLAKGGSVPNEGGRYERSLAAYLGGEEIPVA